MTEPLDVALLGEGMEVLRTLQDAGARVTVLGCPTAPARWSRHRNPWHLDPRPGDARLVEALVDLGPFTSLFYETDRDLLFVSRNRDSLRDAVGMVLPAPDLVEQLVDKALFAALAERAGLPVPATRIVPARAAAARGVDLTFPVIVKPCARDALWTSLTRGQKAVACRDVDELGDFLAVVGARYPTVVVQTHVPGPETRVESYHVYVDSGGRVTAEFTGRKLRTRPAVNGDSTALVTTRCPELLEAGRATVRALGLVGVAKLDFKRGPDDRLWLLEVNARFNLWHRLGAAAGVNLPAFVLADLAGRARPPAGEPLPDVAWCHVPRDLLAARSAGLPPLQWAAWARTCETRAGLDALDPLPFVLGRVLPRVRRGLAAGRSRGTQVPA